MTCIDMWRDFIWIWLSCGGAQCRVVPSGKARLRTAWTTCSMGGQVGLHREVSSAVDSYQEGVIGFVVCSALRDFDGRTPVQCSVTSTCRWFTTTGYTSVVSRTSLSGGTICRSYECCYCCRWPRRRLGWCRQTLPVPGRRIRVILRKSW